MNDPTASRPPRSIACLGDSGVISAWGGIPYFLFDAARRNGFLSDTMNLLEPAYRRHRRLWAIKTLFCLRAPFGYQYSPEAIRRMWDCVPPRLRQGEIISHFQLFPPPDLASAAGVQFTPFIDTTLRQLFGHQQAGERYPSRQIQKDAIRRETELYQASRFLIAMAHETAAVAVHEYGIDARKVFVVRPGANMDEAKVRAYLERRGPSWRDSAVGFDAHQPARLGFIGRDWQRKGLDRLVGAAEILHRRGRPVRVVVIGANPEHLRNNPVVELLGLVSKSTDMQRFLEIVDTFALGCLPSFFEPLGIGTLECLRLGVPVMGAATGGIPDCVRPGSGFLVPAASGAEQIADAIEHHVFDPDRYAGLCRGAVLEAPATTWNRTAELLAQIWSGGGESFRPN